MLIKANEATAGRRIMIFPLVVDATDLNSPETGEASGQPQYSVDGGANWTNTNGTLTGGTNGAYQVQLTQAEVNQAVGTTIIGRYKSANTAEARASLIQIVAVDVNDATAFGMTNLDAAISTRGTADTGDAMTLANGAITAAVIATDAIDGDAIAATAVTEIQNGLATAAALTTVDGKVDTVDTVVDAIKLKTDTIPANPAAVGSAMTLTAAYDAAKTAAAAGAQMDLVNAPNPTAVTAVQNGLALTGEAATAVDTLAIPSAADNADAVWNEARIDHSTAGSFGQGVASVQGNVTGSVDSVTDPVTVGTNNDKTDYALSAAGVSAVQSGLSTLTAQQVWEYGTRTLSSFSTLVADIWAHATRALTDKANFTLTSAYDAAKTAAQAGAKMDIVDAPNVTAVAALQSGLATATDVSNLNDISTSDVGTAVGTALGVYDAATGTDVTAAVSGLSTFNPATTEVDIGKVKGVAVTSVADFKADVSGLAVTGEAATAVGTLTIPTAEVISDAVWDEATADHQTAGSTGKAITDAGSAGDPWTTTLPGAYGDNTAGKILGTNLDATVSSRSTLTAAQVWTNGTRTLSSFGTLVADLVAGVWAAAARTITGGTVTTNSDKTGYSLAADQAVNITKVAGSAVTGVDDFKADVSDLATSAEVTALNDLSAAQVQAAATASLNTYDPPTKAELDSAAALLATAAAVTSLDGKADTIDGIVDAIKLKTDTIPANPAAVGSAMTLAANAISAAAVAADAVTEIQSGLATTANVSAVETKVDTVDTVVDAIKAKTDNLPASPAATGAAMTLTAGERTAVATALLGSTITFPDGETKTVEEILEEVWAGSAGDYDLTGVNWSIRWPGGSDAAFIFEVDDADAPTSRTRI